MGILALMKNWPFPFPLSRVLFPFPFPFLAYSCSNSYGGIPMGIPREREFHSHTHLYFPCVCQSASDVLQRTRSMRCRRCFGGCYRTATKRYRGVACNRQRRSNCRTATVTMKVHGCLFLLTIVVSATSLRARNKSTTARYRERVRDDVQVRTQRAVSTLGRLYILHA